MEELLTFFGKLNSKPVGVEGKSIFVISHFESNQQILEGSEHQRNKWSNQGSGIYFYQCGKQMSLLKLSIHYLNLSVI